MPCLGRHPAPWLQTIGIGCVTFFLLFNLMPAVLRCLETSDTALQILYSARLAPGYQHTSNLTTNLIIATTKADNISWADRLQDAQSIPNLNIIRYVSDDETARYHPPKPKAREALMYFTYLQDFYHDLADVNIFVHADEISWHVDAPLQKSLSFALPRLNLEEVVRRGYLNLRATWRGSGERNSCPNGFSTSATLRDNPKGEEFLMGRAFKANFPGESVPDVLSGPCCSQFAVSRAAVLSRPLEQYERSVKFLIDSNWSDQMIGRTWEHMWPWLFKRQANDCHTEWRMLCMMYGVCFKDQEDFDLYIELWVENGGLRDSPRLWRELFHPRRLLNLENEMADMLLQALERGSDATVREEAGRALT